MAAADERSSAQPYVWRSWTRLDGLPGSQVWAIAQDRSGYIWIGTNEGLVRFDGVRFVSGRQLGLARLPNASVRALFVARDGSVWVGFGTGSIGQLKDGRLQTYTMDDGLPPGVVAGLVEDRHGSIWAATANGLYRLTGGRWTRVALDADGPERAVNTVYTDRHGRLWAGTRAGTYRSESDTPTRFERVTAVPSLSLAGDDAGNVWSVGEASLMLLSASTPRTVVEVAAYGPRRRMVADRQGRLWVGSHGDGLLRVTPGAGAVVEAFSRPGVSNYDDILAVFEDREGNIWVGTPRGLGRGSRGLIRSLPEGNDGITAPVQAVAAAADGSVWVGTANAVHRFDEGGRGAPAVSVALPSRGVALHGDARGAMWVATARTIGRVEHGRFTSLIPVGRLLNRPVAMATDRDGMLWVGDLERGLFRWDGKALVPLPADRYGNRPVFSMLADRAGRVWAGHLDGTISVHENEGAQLYTADDGVVGSVVTGFHEDAGTIWAGSRNGLMRFRAGRIDAVTRDHGLPGHTVTAIAGDSGGNLWVGVSAGVARFRPEDFDKVVTGAAKSLSYTLYDGSDGLRGDPFPVTAPAVARGGDGRLWFLTSDGVAVVSPESHEKNRVAPPVVIETVTADRGAVPLDGDRSLPPRTANLRIDYSALSFVAPEKIRFSYLMEGFDADWVDAGTRRQAFYTNLSPGNYRFRVKASNDGVSSEREGVWAFTLAPAFYQTRWFMAAMVIAAMGGVALAWRVRVRQVQGRFSAILVERTRVAREVHDTLLQSLLGVLFRLDEVASVVGESSEPARDQLVRLRRQVEFYVREARYSIRDLRSPILQSRGLATALRSIGDNLTGERAATFRLDVTGRPRGDLQRIDEHLLRIGQEAMTNALRHAAARTVTAQLRYGPDSVALSVRDDGKGFDTRLASVADGVHWGLRTMRERAEQVGGTLRITSAEGQGTEVAVVVPTPPSNDLID
jgi:ligand-binding sensor domain-containing protein/signal transduction histidine kinase